MTIAVQSDILASLGTLRNQVEHQLAGVSRYRAMVTIEKTIAELSEFSDLTKPLSEIRDTIQAQLSETREYRALRTVERIAPELAEVLASLDDGEAPASEAFTKRPLRSSLPEIGDEEPVAASSAGANAGRADEGASVAASTPPYPASQGPQPASHSRDASHASAPSDRGAESFAVSHDVTARDGENDTSSELTLESETQGAAASVEDEAEPPVAALAYNLAHLLVQSLPPGHADAKAAPPIPRSDLSAETEPSAEADSASRAGKAA